MELRNHAIVFREGNPTKAARAMHTSRVARLSHQRASFATVYLRRAAQQCGHPKGVTGCVIERRIAGYRGNPKHITVLVCQPQGECVIMPRITIDDKLRAVPHIS
jgi:hypothetical protein